MSEAAKLCKWCGGRPKGCIYCANDPTMRREASPISARPIAQAKFSRENLKYFEEGEKIGCHEVIAMEAAAERKLDSLMLKKLLVVVDMGLDSNCLSPEVASEARSRFFTLIAEQNKRQDATPTGL